jgi:hypothetical protein
MVESQEIELAGHIIDSGIMTQLFDRVMDMGGNFEILVFDIGKKKADPSYARLRIAASSKEKLLSILSELHRLGARPVEVKDAYLVPADADRVVPKGFYTTSNHPTQVKYCGEWIPVECIEMDFLIVNPGRNVQWPWHWEKYAKETLWLSVSRESVSDTRNAPGRAAPLSSCTELSLRNARVRPSSPGLRAKYLMSAGTVAGLHCWWAQLSIGAEAR